MARPANTYRAARRAAGKLAHRQNGAGVGKNTPRVSVSPVAFKLPYDLPSRLRPNPKKSYNLQAGNVPGGLRRALQEDAELNAIVESRINDVPVTVNTNRLILAQA